MLRYGAKVVGKRKIRQDESVFLEDVQTAGQSFEGRRLTSFCTVGTRLERCDFRNMRIQDAKFAGGRVTSEYIDCTFDGSKMDHIGGGPSRFVRCSFRNVRLSHWFAHKVELIDCTFSGRLHMAVFNGTVPEDSRTDLRREKNEFHGNDFSEMDLVDVGFRTGVDLSQQRLPSGPEYLYLPDAEVAVRRAKLALLSWSELELRRVALVMLKNMEQNIADGQKQFLLRASDYYPYKSLPRKAVDTLFGLLRGDEIKLF